MLKNLIRAMLVLRLESTWPAASMSAVLACWRARPAIHYILDEEAGRRRRRLERRLDEVYPF